MLTEMRQLSSHVLKVTLRPKPLACNEHAAQQAPILRCDYYFMNRMPNL